MAGPSRSFFPKSPGSRSGRRGLAEAFCVLLLAVVMLVPGCGGRRTDLKTDLFVYDGVDVSSWGGPGVADAAVRHALDKARDARNLAPLKVDYPLGGSVFPPEICPPTFLWHDGDNSAKTWLIDVSFRTTPHHVYVVAAGKRVKREIDPRCITLTNDFRESPYQASAKAWTPDERTWEVMKRHSVDGSATVTIHGLVGTEGASGTRSIVSWGGVTITTSKDPVGAQVFYRDVPLMPSATKRGVIMPLAQEAVPLIAWRIRDLSKPEATVVMQHLPTCGNCHSFSRDGRTLAMDIDGPDGDKGAHIVKAVRPHMVIETKDVFTWNSFREGPEPRYSFGLFPQISPDGRYDVATVHEAVFVQNYMDYRFLQTFYPTQGILAIYYRRTGEIKALPGADETDYVQSNAVWSPDGKELVFIRAKAKVAYGTGPRATFANDPNETQILYDLYRIPFNGGKGGTAVPVRGASDNGMSNSFPRFSPDGKWIVFVQAKNGLLMRPDSKLYIIPAQGGTPRLMNCNTTLMNSYHSWSPNSRWLVFSSKADTPYTQMYLTHVDEEGNDSPAILIPNSTAANRAVNLPELVNIPPGGLVDITSPATEYRGHLEKAKELLRKGLLPEVEAELQKSIELKSDYPETHYVFGTVSERQGRFDEAMAHYRRAIELRPEYYAAYNDIGVILFRQGKTQEGIASMERAVTIYPDYADGHNNLGIVFLQLGQPRLAIEHFKRTLEIDPGYASAESAWGHSLLMLGDLDGAVVHFEACLKINPGFLLAHSGVADARSRQGRFEEAVTHYRKALEIDPAYAKAANGLAWVLATHKDAKVRDGAEALRLATAACESAARQNAEFLVTLAAAQAEVGRFDDAVRTADTALQLARTAGRTTLAATIEARLAVLKQRKPLRD